MERKAYFSRSQRGKKGAAYPVMGSKQGGGFSTLLPGSFLFADEEETGACLLRWERKEENTSGRQADFSTRGRGGGKKKNRWSTPLPREEKEKKISAAQSPIPDVSHPEGGGKKRKKVPYRSGQGRGLSHNN